MVKWARPWRTWNRCCRCVRGRPGQKQHVRCWDASSRRSLRTLINGANALRLEAATYPRIVRAGNFRILKEEPSVDASTREHTMSDRSTIEWTDATWNPVRGCTLISPGCAHCYAQTFAERFRGVPGHPYEQGFDLRLVPEKLAEPLRWRTPPHGLRQLDERPVPQGRARRLRLRRRPRHATGPLAHLPGAHQALRASARSLARAAPRRGGRSRTSGGVSASRTAGTACRGSTTSAPPPRPCASCRSSRCSKTSGRSI